MFDMVYIDTLSDPGKKRYGEKLEFLFEGKYPKAFSNPYEIESNEWFDDLLSSRQ